MIILLFALYTIFLLLLLIVGLRKRKEILLLILNVLWWLGSFFSAYFILLAWQDRMYSENWAMMGVLFIAFPYILIITPIVIIELYLIRKWDRSSSKIFRLSAWLLLAFLLLQVLIGLTS
ncbi:MAG: hypothetical protein KKA84_03050 [Bacteroidetes bacterium]|nr:hypothetical protein [Bacteroidota bacterium]